MVEICQQILDKEENMKIQFGFFWGSQTKSEINAKNAGHVTADARQMFSFFLSEFLCVGSGKLAEKRGGCVPGRGSECGGHT